jgi:exodeoxyribonuclease VII large subunit
VYFDLKDLDAKISCTIWKSQVARALRFELAEGMSVIAHGSLDVYAPRGTYSLLVQRLEQEGIGALLVQFEKLKAELAARGWFERKRAIPPMPRAVGVVTSRDGAALQDFLRTRSLRWPLYPVVLAHASVQGKGAAAEIAKAIARLNAQAVDVIALVRGGGSIEDLWSFNELALLEAMWNSRVPIVTGVGHEIDVTLADLVADHRAHTPTDAAQTVIPHRSALVERLQRAGNHLLGAMDEIVAKREECLADAASSRALRDPNWLLGSREDELEHLCARMTGSTERALQSRAARLSSAHRTLESASPRRRVERVERRMIEARARLAPALERALERRELRFEVAGGKLDALSPLKILARGYSITTREKDGLAVRDASSLHPGERIVSRIERGRVISTVDRVEPDRPRP